MSIKHVAASTILSCSSLLPGKDLPQMLQSLTPRCHSHPHQSHFVALLQCQGRCALHHAKTTIHLRSHKTGILSSILFSWSLYPLEDISVHLIPGTAGVPCISYSAVYSSEGLWLALTLLCFLNSKVWKTQCLAHFCSWSVFLLGNLLYSNDLK